MQRRTLLVSLSVVGTVAVAGCSNSSEPATDPEDGESEEGSDKDTEQDQQEKEEHNSDQENELEQKGDDQVHKGEEELEQYMETDEGITLMGQSKYNWVELENIEDQTEKPITEFAAGTVFEELARGGSAPNSDIDTVYVAVQSGGANSLDFVYLDSDNWDEDISVDENARKGFYQDDPSNLEEDEVLELFSNDISGYSDVSDDFPDEYLEAIEE